VAKWQARTGTAKSRFVCQSFWYQTIARVPPELKNPGGLSHISVRKARRSASFGGAADNYHFESVEPDPGAHTLPRVSDAAGGEVISRRKNPH